MNVKVIRVVEISGEYENVLRQLQRSLKLGTHNFADVSVDVRQLAAFTEPGPVEFKRGIHIPEAENDRLPSDL